MSRTLLIDADLIAYRATAGNQDTIDWNGDGSLVSVDARLDDAKQQIKNDVEWFMDELKADDCIICLSDEVLNFRKTIDPTYKSNRNGVERPVHLYDLKEWMAERWSSRIIPTFEADDVMGILATEPHEGERIIVSNDKDMRTIPGLLCVPPLTSEGKIKVERISPYEADRFHLWQTLVGDVCDGYPGCPGVGPVAAEKLLDGHYFYSWTHAFKSGPRKGTEEVRWAMSDGPSSNRRSNPWLSVVTAYERRGLTEADAIRQARLAFILRSSHYVDGRRLDWNPQKSAVS